MGLNEEIIGDVRQALQAKLAMTRVTHAPASWEADAAFLQGGVKFDATVLYVEVRGMADFLRDFGWEAALKLQRIYLRAIFHIAEALSGAVRTVRYDCLLIFFPGTTKAMVSNAVRCAMHYTYLFSDQENALYTLLNGYDIFRGFSFDYGLGLDYGEVLCSGVEAGRSDCRLLWLGAAVDRAERLGALADAEARIVASKYVCDNLQDRVKYYKGENMWRELSGVAVGELCYATNFQWSFA